MYISSQQNAYQATPEDVYRGECFIQNVWELKQGPLLQLMIVKRNYLNN